MAATAHIECAKSNDGVENYDLTIEFLVFVGKQSEKAYHILKTG